MRLFFVLILVSPRLILSQDLSKLEIIPTGSIDLFYGYDFNKPKTSKRLPFLYNHNLHNQIGLNMASLGVQLQYKKCTSRIIFHTGSYVMQNYASEPPLFRNIQEANIKWNFGKKDRMSLDFGILPSHIGLESAISFDNATFTRSLVAEQSPYYMNGLKLNYKIKDSMSFSLMALNGWQKIVKIEGNSLLSFGSQLNWQINDRISFNWSTFGGTEYPDSLRKMRYYSDVFGSWKWSRNSTLYLGFDLGVEQKYTNSSIYNGWLAPLIIVDYAISDYLKLATRFEYFSDPNGVLIVPEGFKGTKIFGTSFNTDYSLNEFLKFRLECKLYRSKEAIFLKSNNHNVNTNIFLCGGISMRF